MIQKNFSKTVFASILVFAMTTLTPTTTTVARADSTGADRALIQKVVREELQRMIGEEGLLDQAIERGIAAYVEKQRAQARAKQQRGTAAKAAKAKNVRPVSDQDHIYGDPKAAITLVEYSDFECPFCKRFHVTAKQLVDQSEGKVNWVYRHFPLAFHNPGAQKQSEASECAAKQGGNDAFWSYSTLIYQRTRSNGKGFPVSDLVPLAKEIGLDVEPFERCLESGEMNARVKADYQNGIASGVTGTPGNILLHNASGDVLAMSGALPLPRLQAGVEMLNRKHSAQ